MAKEVLKEAGNAVSSMKSKLDSSQVREDYETLKDDARIVVEDARVLGQSLKAEGHKQWEVAEEKAKQGLHSAKEVGHEKLKALESYVGQNPGQALAIAFIGGVLASLIFGSRRS